jgi:hypothetical protein
MTGTVVDAETGKPIEGAVVLVEWTKKTGIGDYHTESVKVVEAMTDKQGKFTVSGIFDPFVDAPDVTVYKKGYVAWSSRWIFPGYENRTNFRWGDFVFKLEQFKSEYSHDAHTSFIDSCVNASLSKYYEVKKHFLRAIEWEQDLAFQERMRKNKQK